MTELKDTRQRLLDSARDLIHARSYVDVGVQAICELADVKKGSFYHFFPSKRDLTLAVLDDIYIDTKEQFLAEVFKKDIPPLARFDRFVEFGYQYQKEIADSTGHILGCPFGNLAAEMSTQDDLIRKKLEYIFSQLQDVFKEALTEAVDAGEISHIDINSTAEAMLAYLEGIMLLAKTNKDLTLIRRLGPAMANIRIPLKA